MILMAFTLACGSVACGSEDEAEDTSCAAPTGDYTLTFWPTSGDCGLINAVLAPEGRPPVGGCEDSTETLSEDRCTGEYFGRCPAEDPYAEIELTITVRWEKDASLAFGEATARAFNADGSLGCTGTYDIKMSPFNE